MRYWLNKISGENKEVRNESVNETSRKHELKAERKRSIFEGNSRSFISPGLIVTTSKPPLWNARRARAQNCRRKVSLTTTFPGRRGAPVVHNNRPNRAVPTRRGRRRCNARMSYVEQPPLGREIAVPAKLPLILKQFCKAAIRTQPYDLLKWSGSYFRALAEGEEPPVKSRLEYPPPSTASGLTLGFLRVLLRQFGNYNKTLSIETVSRRWDCLCLDRRDLDTILAIGRFRRTCQVKKFLAVAVGLLGANLTETMIMVCQLFSHEPDGGSAMIPLTLFMEIYEYLAGLACDGSEKDTLDQDTTERTAGKESLVDRTCSINSQDTDVDVNSELISKDEVDLSKTDPSELIENSSLEKEATNYEEKGDESSTQKDDVSTGKDHTDNDMIGKQFCGVKYANEGSLSSETEKRIKVTCYPNVPGIGPRVSAGRVASVTAWMLECAKLQEGMIGPRNIRHMSCPSLYERSTSRS